MPNKAFKRRNNSWLFYSIHIIVNDFAAERGVNLKRSHALFSNSDFNNEQ